MPRPAPFALSFLALLIANPAAALSVSAATCNEDSASLAGDGVAWTLSVNEAEVPIDPDVAWGDLSCVSRDGATFFALTRTDPDGSERYFLLDPAGLSLAEIDAEEARALGVLDEDDGLLDE